MGKHDPKMPTNTKYSDPVKGDSNAALTKR